MSGPREGPNPLRPYYIPPSVGTTQKSTTHLPSTHSHGSRPAAQTATLKSSLGTSARDLLSDLDYSEYLSDASPSIIEVAKSLADQATWKYVSVLVGQPFEVAKTILQVHVPSASHAHLRIRGDEKLQRDGEGEREGPYDLTSDESDPDSPSYFTSTVPELPRPTRSRRRHYDSSRSNSPPITPLSSHPAPPPRSSQHPHLPPTSSLVTVVSQLWNAEGAWGIWKGTNSTFIHSVLVSTATAFARALICALLALPDPGLSASQAMPPYLITMPSAVGGLDIISSPYPLMSLVVAVSSSGLAGIILAPIDIARTMLMLTSSTHPPRSIIPAMKSLRSWTLPFSIAPVTILHSTLPTLISASTPLFLRSRMGIDPILTPNMYTIATFASQMVELGVRLPIETVLRRGQMAVVHSTELLDPIQPKRARAASLKMQTVVEIGSYKGLVGTMYHIVFEEGTRKDFGRELPEKPGADRRGLANRCVRVQQGQGIEGLYRGWRVGIWGLVGVWGAASLGGTVAREGEF